MTHRSDDIWAWPMGNPSYCTADEPEMRVATKYLRATPAREAAEDMLEALRKAEAALADIGDAEREDGDDLKWCEVRAAKALPAARDAIARATGGAA